MRRRDARAFDRPLLIELRTTAQGGTGQTNTVAWEQFARTRGRLVPLRASERFAADQFNAKVTVRYELAAEVDGLQHDMRVTDDQTGTVYNITGIEQSADRGRGQMVMCFEHAD